MKVQQQPINIFREVIRRTKNFACLLEYEYELTMKSDKNGFISKGDFVEVSYELFGQFIKKQDIEAVYQFSLEDGKLHS